MQRVQIRIVTLQIDLTIMAEALVILGVAASVAQFCEFANTLTHQIREFVNCVDEAPGVLRDITIQLPLLVKICETFEVDEGDLDTETLCSVLTGCIGHLKEFSDLTDKIRPTATELEAQTCLEGC